MTGDAGRLEALERWGPRLFVVAGVFLLVAASHRGITFLVEGVAFNDWIGLAGLFGRLAALLGTAGLAVRIRNRNAGLGKLSRALVTIAVVFTVGLLTLAVLENAGVTTPAIAVFGLGTFVLSVLTFALFGAAIVRTGGHPPAIGILLLVVAGSLLVVFVGQAVAPEGVVGTVVEGFLFVLYTTIGYRLRDEVTPSRGSRTAPDATP